MANIFPYSNFHDLNLDWLLQQVKQLRTDVDGLIGSATPSNITPQMDGAGAPGVSVNYSRGDHQHPTDTSRASANDLADEVTARTNKDRSLDYDIAAVDAKIHFSASNPLMDGSATAGFSTDQARADHIHPTDTSRAAAADLTQEISDRGNADITLQNNINAVDAKIVLATGAPLMDSSSATPGSSTSMARADHVHPTDTSRASATDLETLTARVNSFTGSAIASDAMPQMDGVGSAGTGGNYSRGDHVHPSDTSKVNKDGDTMTGPLRLQAAFIPELSQGFKHVNAIGWIRVANVPNVQGTTVNFEIVRKGDVAPAETHHISMRNTQYGITFIDETSVSDDMYITHIRYSNAGYVDIYMDQNYDSDIGVLIQAIGPTEADTAKIKIVPFTGVSATPAGETILTSYNFRTNTDLGGANVDKDASFGGTFYRFRVYSYPGNHFGFISFNIALPALTENTETTMANIPLERRPTVASTTFTLIGQGGSIYNLNLYPNGDVTITAVAAAGAQFMRGVIVYPM